jgi:hypothetical protein
MEKSMATKTVSIKPVVKEIDKAEKALKKILPTAPPAEKKELNLMIKELKELRKHAKKSCHQASLNLWVPAKS